MKICQIGAHKAHSTSTSAQAEESEAAIPFDFVFYSAV